MNRTDQATDIPRAKRRTEGLGGVNRTHTHRHYRKPAGASCERTV